MYLVLTAFFFLGTKILALYSSLSFSFNLFNLYAGRVYCFLYYIGRAHSKNVFRAPLSCARSWGMHKRKINLSNPCLLLAGH